MGLLDDAIREHLDLKRARGGDPAEIERMEREALGPVRREPPIGSTRLEAVEERLPAAAQHGYAEDLEELQDLGYQDSTAPHPHVHHGRGDDALEHRYFEDQEADPFAAAPEEIEQPKRRFLRRSRPAATPDPALPDTGFHEDPVVGPHGGSGHTEAIDAPGHPEALEDDAPHQPADQQHDYEQREPPRETGPGGATPPHLQFDHPPKRPRFSAEPPSLDSEADEDATAATSRGAEQGPTPAPATPPAPPADQPEDGPEAQETTEFDVQKHIAETRFQPDPEAPVKDDVLEGEEPLEDEDVLEETPEFLQDTPEHDRLWFEQRPPRDFDFDG